MFPQGSRESLTSKRHGAEQSGEAGCALRSSVLGLRARVCHCVAWLCDMRDSQGDIYRGREGVCVAFRIRERNGANVPILSLCLTPPWDALDEVGMVQKRE